MRQLPELLQTFPDNYRDIDLTEIRTWINRMIQTVPQSIETQVITNKKPPMLTDSGGFQIFSLGHGSVADEIKGRNSKNNKVGD